MTMLRRFSSRLRQQDWVAVVLDLGVVILGVFLGLEAANWNQARQDRVEEKRYYAQIVVDLRRDLETLGATQRRSLAYDGAAETVLEALEHGIPRGTDSSDFAKAIHYAGFLYVPSPSRRTYDELISTGNLRLLREDRTKDAIAAYYEDFAQLRQWDILLRQQQADYWSASAGVVPRRVLQAALMNSDPQVSAAEAQDVLKRARATPRLKEMLIGMAAHQARVRRDSVNLAGEARALMEELQPKAS
jgi:hypothetical protein